MTAAQLAAEEAVDQCPALVGASLRACSTPSSLRVSEGVVYDSIDETRSRRNQARVEFGPIMNWSVQDDRCDRVRVEPNWSTFLPGNGYLACRGTLEEHGSILSACSHAIVAANIGSEIQFNRTRNALVSVERR